MVEKKHLVGTTLVLVIISSSFLYSTTIAANDQPRINQISIFADKEVPVWVQRNREIDSGDLDNPIIGKQPVWWSKFFHNKIVSWWKIWKNNYLETFSTQFLFFNGDPNLRHSTSNGMFLTIDILGLIFGIYYLLSNLRIKNYKWLLVFLLLSPIPSSLTKDGGGGHHASRLILVGTFLVLIIGLGWWRIYERLKKIRFGNLIKVSLIFAYIICFSFYYHHYQVHYRLESARSFSYGYKQAIEKILNKYTDKGFSTLKITQSIDPPLPYLWFFNSVPAKDIQEKGLDYGGKMGTITKIETINWLSETSDLENISETILPNQLYLLSERDIVPLDMTPKDKLLIDILETVRFPDNEPAFYLLARKD